MAWVVARASAVALLACSCAGRGPTGSVADRAAEALTNAQSLRSRGEIDAALAEFERAIELNPELTTAYLGAGELYQARQDHVGAERAFGSAARLDPRSFDAQYGHGLSLQLLGRLRDAIEAYRRAIEIRPDDFSTNLNLGTAYYQLGATPDAVERFRHASMIDPDSAPARVNLAAALRDTGRYDEAIEEYQQAADLMELTPELLLNLADCLGLARRYAEMIGTLEQLTRLEPSAIAYERLGSGLFRAGRRDEALTSFRKSLTLDPDHYPALNGVGVCLLNRFLESARADLESRDEAIRVLRRSLQINRDQPRVVELLSRYG